jgi:hypothetical protein
MSPIDVVFTWVDGLDKHHEQLRQKHLPRECKRPYCDTAPFRWESSGEIIQSVLSVKHFAPWIRTIWVVTSLDQCVPAAIKDLVTQVNDYDLLPDEASPVFNSHAIESVIHRIPNLAERFLYLCDDEFFGAPVKPSDFFTDNGIQPRFSSTPAPQGIPTKDTPGWLAARMNNRMLITQISLWKQDTTSLVHHGRPVITKEMHAMWNHSVLGPRLLQTANSKFRSESDVEPMGLSVMWSLGTNPDSRGVRAGQKGALKSRFFNIGDNTNLDIIGKFLLLYRPALFCLNSTMSAPRKDFDSMLRTRLPHNCKLVPKRKKSDRVKPKQFEPAVGIVVR